MNGVRGERGDVPPNNLGRKAQSDYARYSSAAKNIYSVSHIGHHNCSLRDENNEQRK
jgi:hypothetical protein